MQFRSPLLAAGLGALVLAGCGSENAALIPPEDADQLTALVQDAGDAVAAGECDRARRSIQEARSSLAGLPARTDRALKRNVREWLEHLDAAIADECKPKEAQEEEEPEETQTASPSPTSEATETPTETATPTPTATETATPEPTATTDPDTGGQGSPEEPPATGGVPSEETIG